MQEHARVQARNRQKHQAIVLTDELERIGKVVRKLDAFHKALARQVGAAQQGLTSQVEVLVGRSLEGARRSQGAHIDRAVREAVESSRQERGGGEAGETAELRNRLENVRPPHNFLIYDPYAQAPLPMCLYHYVPALLH